MWSDAISEYLKVFKLAKSEKERAEETLADCNDQLQDLYHQLEFADMTYHQRARIANKITEVRRERRQAKYQIEQTTPIEEWATRNFNAIKSMEKMLGEVRAAERHTDPDNLSYAYRTTVIQDLLGTKEGKISGR